MLKRILNWKVLLALVLILFSALFYILSYNIFHDGRYIVMTILDDIGFAFLEVLLVTLVIHRLLSVRENKILLKKLNMVIGAFFSEVGTELIQKCVVFDTKSTDIASKLIITNAWSEKKFMSVIKNLNQYDFTIDYKRGDIEGLKSFLLAKRGFLLGLLENQNLLEHESFTNLLWASFHLTDELSRRRDLKALTELDRQHLCTDIKRTYSLIIGEWLAYMKHLKTDYPYLFSLAMRTNPFDLNASVELK